MSSGSSSSSRTTSKTRDGRVAGDNGAIGVSSEGDVNVHIVADEAFALADTSLEAVRDIAETAGEGAVDAIANMRSLAETSSKEAHESARDSIAAFGDLAEIGIEGAYENARDGTAAFGDLAGDAIAAITGLAESSTKGSRSTLESVTGQFADALATTQQHARSESTQIAEQLIRIGLPAAALAFMASKIWGK